MKQNPNPEAVACHSPGRAPNKSILLRFKVFTVALVGVLAATAHFSSATPVTHGISAANVTVVQNDASNNPVSVTLVPTVVINDMRILNNSQNSRADYFFQIGNIATDDVAGGIAISSISDNGRDNHEGDGTNYGTSGIDSGASSSPGSSGQYWVPVFGSATKTSATFPEYNFDYSVAYFPYSNGWYGGWLVNAGGTNNGVVTNIASDKLWGNTNMVLGRDVIPLGGGKVNVNLTRFGLDCRSNAILLCAGGKNEENFASCQTNTDGSWTVQTRDDVSGSLEADPSIWVCIPLTNHLVIAGRFMGDGSVIQSNSTFHVTNTYVGTYHLTIPGTTPGHGVLIISGEAGGTYNSDNIVSYQATADGWDIQTRDCGSTATAAAPNLQNLPATDAVVSFVYIPAATPGLSVTPTNGLATSENGTSASFTVALDSPPLTNVTISLSSSQPSYGVPNTNSLSFNSTNWNVPQTVTVIGVSNNITNGGLQPYSINFGAATSLDTNYNGLTAASVSLVHSLNNQAGITVWPTGGLVTTESGGTANFFVFLNSAPASPVSINISSSNTGEGSVSNSTLTFTAANWFNAQSVTVTGVDDTVVDGDQNYSIIISPAVSADGGYNGLDAPDVTLVNKDNEVAGVNVSPSGSISVIEGSTAGITVALAAQPVSNVTISYTSGNPSVGTLSPSSLVFTPGNWNVPQTITLAGVDNSVNNGNVSYTLNGTVTSTNPGYSTLLLPTIAATTIQRTAIHLTSGQAVYGFGMPPVGIDGHAMISDSSASSFTSASLTVTLVTNGNALDALGIRNDGTNAGQIGVSGSSITYSGSAIGTASGGSSATPLSITLQSGTTLDAVQALARAITFSTTATNYLPRTLQFTVNDGLGAIVSATKSVRVGLLRVTQYQDGADYGYGAYAGQQDIEISQLQPDTAYPAGDSAANGLFVDAPRPGYPEEEEVLLRFDNLVGTNSNQIPPGAIIVSAELNINILNSGNGASLNRMLIPWDATNSTWDSFSDGFGDNGIYADDITARSQYDSQLGVYIVDPNTGAVSGSTTGTGNVAIGVTSDVQAWVNGETNNGWAFIGFTEETDGFGFSPSEDTNVVNRPSLKVLWVPAGTASVSFRYGVNGYTGVMDANVLQATPDTNYASAITLWSDQADVGILDETEYLIQFSNIVGGDTNQIPTGAHVEVAMLDLASLNDPNAPGDGGQFYAVLQPWQDTNTTWNTWGVNGIQTDGIQAATTPTVTIGSPTLSPNVQSTRHSLEMTADVQNWVNGTSPNYGWAAIPWPGGSDGWGSNSSEDPATNTRPQLRVYFTGGAPGKSRATLLPLAVSPTQVIVQFTGTINASYTVQRTSVLTGGWSNIGTATVGTNGIASFTDSTPLPGAAFYRISN